ncbi:MAG: exo-alpha-sialidase, partial [Planctomycetes bacterium]|nr:exo-alpha-sialidase [Planctomycetota bacterium]
TSLPTSSWAAPRRPRAAVDLPHVYTFMEHSLNGQDDVWMDWSQDLGLTWGATGVAINTATLGSGGDVDGMLVVADDQRVAVLYVDDRLNGSNTNANNQAVVAVSNGGGADFVAGTHVEVPLSLKDPNPIYDLFMAGDVIAAMYETNCGAGGEGITVSLSADGGQSFTHHDVTSFDGCGTFPSGVDVDDPRMCLSANGDCNLIWQDDRTLAGGAGGNTVNNVWVTGIKYPRLVDDTANGLGVRFQDASPAASGLQCYVFFSLSSAPNSIALDAVGTTLQIGYDPLTQASVILATQTFPSANLDLVGPGGAVDFPLIPNVGQLLGLPVYAIGATVSNSGVTGPYTDPILMQ